MTEKEILNKLDKLVQKEKDKWDSGMKNKYMETYSAVAAIKNALIFSNATSEERAALVYNIKQLQKKCERQEEILQILKKHYAPYESIKGFRVVIEITQDDINFQKVEDWATWQEQQVQGEE